MSTGSLPGAALVAVTLPLSSRRRGAFNEPAALRAFNDAAAAQARLAQHCHDLAVTAAGRGASDLMGELHRFAAGLGAPVALDDAAVRDSAVFATHSLLRHALGEGRRLDAHQLTDIARGAVRDAAVAQLADDLAAVVAGAQPDALRAALGAALRSDDAAGALAAFGA